ncbi:MAG: hypothetical protein QOF54_1712 [Solirubrobacteraceae bacterium]|nr:hypothetical protein [Solirubrobacteraceae bacterium]
MPRRTCSRVGWRLSRTKLPALSRGNRPSAHERTAEEREHDRLERERRRAERAGQDPPQALSGDVAAGAGAPHDDPAPPSDEPHFAAAPPDDQTPSSDEAQFAAALPDDPAPSFDEPHFAGAPLALSSEATVGDPPAPESSEPPFAPTDDPIAGAPTDEPTRQASVASDPPTDEQPVASQPVSPEDARWPVEPDAALPDEAPLPPPLDQPPPRRTVRIGHDRAGAPAAPAGGGRGSGGVRSGRRGDGGAPRRRVTRARIAALVALALAVALVWFLVSLFQPFAGAGSGRVIVSIPKGASSSKIGSILAHDGVVSSGFFFGLRATLAGKRGSLHSGRFELKRRMSYSAAIDALSKPPPKAIVVKVVIPEGYTRRQIAELVSEDALAGSYLAASRRSRVLDPRRYGAPGGTADLEGFLFPATYELAAGAPAAKLVEEQLAAFRERFSSDDVRRARALHVTPYQLLTVASMIEREAQTAGDRPKIAAVVYNRLRQGIPLGIDATIYYAVEQQKGIATYTGELTESQLRIDSPYNTRTHKGLPPTPISNPGTASIQAAAHPAHAPYLYYVAGADGCGEQVFSRTSAEFEKNVAAYDAAVKRNGGHPPRCKKK